MESTGRGSRDEGMDWRRRVVCCGLIEAIERKSKPGSEEKLEKVKVEGKKILVSQKWCGSWKVPHEPRHLLSYLDSLPSLATIDPA